MSCTVPVSSGAATAELMSFSFYFILARYAVLNMTDLPYRGLQLLLGDYCKLELTSVRCVALEGSSGDIVVGGGGRRIAKVMAVYPRPRPRLHGPGVERIRELTHWSTFTVKAL
jgi:hypothetical protein